ncbi:MAG: WbqC family protein [Endomicrobiia bacterium]|nr:WbqC family protein [Endomicrobiia bacterium]
MRVAVHQPQYIPWLGYFHKMASCDLFVFLDDVQYKKREFQNRNKIRAPDGSLWLTVPVVTKGLYEQKISNVEIDNSRGWRAEHLKSIETNYARAPYAARYLEYFENLYNTPHRRLSDLNLETIRFIAGEFGVKTPSRFASEFGLVSASTRRIVDICLKLGADEYLSGAGGRDYLDEKLFEENGIRLVYQEFVHPVYHQVFGGFEPYMSAIDIIFNEGAHARDYIRK